MKKKLNEASIANELRGASLFFQKPADVEGEETTPEIQPQAKPLRRTPPSKKPAALTATPEAETTVSVAIADQATPAAAEAGAKKEEITAISPTPSHVDVVETIRKNVKRLGKESTVYRFTPEEKSALADIVYTYKRNGVRTSENEVIRIAMNWLLEDYRIDGKSSVLAQVLDKLNA